MSIDFNSLDIQPLSVSEIRKRFDSWSNIRDEYLRLTSGFEEFSEQETDRIAAAFLQIETTLLMSAAKRVPRAMSRLNLSYQDRPGRIGQNTASLRPHAGFPEMMFGDRSGEFYLQTDIDAEGLPHVTDEFWDEVVILSKYPGFSYCERLSSKTSSPEAKAIQRSGRSHIYKLIRNYTLDRICGGVIEDLGYLEICWPIQTDWEDFRIQLEDAFARLSRINSALYRVRYLREKRLEKAYKTRFSQQEAEPYQ